MDEVPYDNLMVMIADSQQLYSISLSRKQNQSFIQMSFLVARGSRYMGIVFALGVDRKSPRIVIGNGEWGTNYGVLRTQWPNHGTIVPKESQSTPYPGTDKQPYTTDAPLVIEFRKLFLRDTTLPRKGYWILRGRSQGICNECLACSGVRSLVPYTYRCFVFGKEGKFAN